MFTQAPTMDNRIEDFLLHLEKNQQLLFKNHPDYIVLPLLPFLSLVHVDNLYEILDALTALEKNSGGYLMQYDACIVIAVESVQPRGMDLRLSLIRILEEMRF